MDTSRIIMGHGEVEVGPAHIKHIDKGWPALVNLIVGSDATRENYSGKARAVVFFEGIDTDTAKRLYSGLKENVYLGHTFHIAVPSGSSVTVIYYD